MYEECGDVDTIARTTNATPRTIYKYLDPTYMNPKGVNNLLNGNNTVALKDIISSAKRYSF